MRNFKKMPEAAGVGGGLREVTDLDLPYTAISGDGAGGFTMGEVPYGVEDGGRHGMPFTAGVTLAKAGRT